MWCIPKCFLEAKLDPLLPETVSAYFVTTVLFMLYLYKTLLYKIYIIYFLTGYFHTLYFPNLVVWQIDMETLRDIFS